MHFWPSKNLLQMFLETWKLGEGCNISLTLSLCKCRLPGQFLKCCLSGPKQFQTSSKCLSICLFLQKNGLIHIWGNFTVFLCSVFTPYYSEVVLYSLDELYKKNEDGISTLFYLQKIYPGFLRLLYYIYSLSLMKWVLVGILPILFLKSGRNDIIEILWGSSLSRKLFVFWYSFFYFVVIRTIVI